MSNTSWYVVALVDKNEPVYVIDFTSSNVFTSYNPDDALKFDTYDKADRIRKHLEDHKAVIIRIVAAQ
jgi:hypothetical protein